MARDGQCCSTKLFSRQLLRESRSAINVDLAGKATPWIRCLNIKIDKGIFSLKKVEKGRRDLPVFKQPPIK